MISPLSATARSITLACQAVVSGRVLDSLTGAAPRGILLVRLIDRDTGKAYSLLQTILSDGSFAFHAAPERVFPRLAVQTYHLRVEAGASSYTPDAFDFDVGPVAGQPATVSVPEPTPGIGALHVRLFTGGGLPHTGINLSLDRQAVRLLGRVVVSTDPTAGVPGATIQQNPPGGDSTTADSGGFFAFSSPLPVVLSLQLRVSVTGFENTTMTYEPDYTRPTNQVTILLKPS